MSDQPPIDVFGQWGKLNDSLVALVDYAPDNKMNWSPREGLWSLRGIIVHIILARHNWIANDIRDGEETPNVIELAQTKDGMREHLRQSFGRIQRAFADSAALDGVYDTRGEERRTGHWIAYHLLEHDIHHRADIFHYLALLDIETPEVGTP